MKYILVNDVARVQNAAQQLDTIFDHMLQAGPCPNQEFLIPDAKEEEVMNRFPDFEIQSLRFRRSRVVRKFAFAETILMVVVELGAIFLANRVSRKTADYCYKILAAFITQQIPKELHAKYEFKSIMSHARLMNLYCPDGMF